VQKLFEVPSYSSSFVHLLSIEKFYTVLIQRIGLNKVCFFCNCVFKSELSFVANVMYHVNT